MTKTNKLSYERGQDFALSSTNLPYSTKFLDKGLARTHRTSAGKVILGYERLEDELLKGKTSQQAARSVNRMLSKEAKVKTPCGGGKLCGLVALRHSKYFNAESQIYDAVISGEIVTGDMLRNKADAIDAYATLMGIRDNPELFTELCETMPKRLQKYFSNVRKVHKGRLGITSPFGFRKFSDSLTKGLYGDSLAFAQQEEIGCDFGFTNPIASKSEFARLIEGAPSFKKAAIPTAMYYLSGMAVYASEHVEETVKTHTNTEVMEAVTTAGIFAAMTGEEAEDATTTFTTLFTTTLG